MSRIRVSDPKVWFATQEAVSGTQYHLEMLDRLYGLENDRASTKEVYGMAHVSMAAIEKFHDTELCSFDV